MIDVVYRYDPSHPVERPRPADPGAARRQLDRGNREFASLIDPHGPPVQTRIIASDPSDFGWGAAAGLAPAQAPFAAFLGCSDARVPTEVVFGQGCNDLFVVRVAGNVLGTECLGSLRYAAQMFRGTLQLIVVLAHGHCGAITAAVDAYMKPQGYLDFADNFALRAIVDRLFVSVRGAARALEAEHGRAVATAPGYRQALIDTAVVVNAAWTAYCLRQEFPHDGQHPPGPEVVYGVYDLGSRLVGLPVGEPADGAAPPLAPGLHPPPVDPASFAALTREVAAAARVNETLARG